MIDESQAYIDKDGRLFQVNNGRKFYLDKFQAENTAVISKTKNLPFDDQAEEHRLKDNTVYKFDGIVTSDYPIILGSTTPLVGNHGSVDGFIHTGGGGVAIKGSDAGLFMRDLYVHAPFGTIFDITGGVDSEVLVESVSFSDAAGIGNIASLGTIDGMRVPSFKGCNFGNFDGGLTFTGEPDKIFIADSPFRNVDDSGVTILSFDDSFSVGIVDMTSCYVKGVQPDTEVIRVESGATVSEVFQYRGTTHDSTVTKDNILNGQADSTVEPYWVSDSYPTRDSKVGGSLIGENLPQTITGSGSSLTQINVPTTELNTQRISESENGVVEIDVKRDLTVLINLTSTVIGANPEFNIGIAKNNSVLSDSVVNLKSVNNSKPMPASLSYTLGVSQGDTISVFLEHVSENSDIDIGTFNLSIAGF